MNGHYKEFPGVINMLWCDDCWQKYDLARFENLPDLFDEGVNSEVIDPLLNDYLSVYEEMHRYTWCEKCIAELQTTAEGYGETHV